MACLHFHDQRLSLGRHSSLAAAHGRTQISRANNSCPALPCPTFRSTWTIQGLWTSPSMLQPSWSRDWMTAASALPLTSLTGADSVQRSMHSGGCAGHACRQCQDDVYLLVTGRCCIAAVCRCCSKPGSQTMELRILYHHAPSVTGILTHGSSAASHVPPRTSRLACNHHGHTQ